MADGRRENRWRQWFVWCGVAMLALGPPGYLGVLWTRHQWAIEGLTNSNHTVNDATKVREDSLVINNVLPASGLVSIRSRFEFASQTRITDEIPDIHAPMPIRPFFSPFPPLDVHIYAPQPLPAPDQTNTSTTNAIEMAVGFTSRLNALHSLLIASPGTGPLLDRRWRIRELTIEHRDDFPPTPDTWNNLQLERTDQSMPRLHRLSLCGVDWDRPVTFPEQGFSSLVSLDLFQITTEQFVLRQHPGLKYLRIDGDVGALIVSNCPDLERLEIDSLRGVDSIAIQHLPRLKGLYLQYVNDIAIKCVLAELPELETVYLEGDFKATHLQGLAEMPKLKRVGLVVWKLDDEIVDQLLRIKPMEELHLAVGNARSNLAKLATHPKLKAIQIRFYNHSKANQSEAKALAENGRVRVEVLK